MNAARLPLIPTVLVVLAAATMVALGFWQLGRGRDKDALIARYATVDAQGGVVEFPQTAREAERALYRRSQVICRQVLGIAAISGTRADGAKGWAHNATCLTEGGRRVQVALGFSEVSASPPWAGGSVDGVVAPGPRLVADPPVGGLQPLARPDPRELPNNHFAYALQWFIFAATALVIYGLALRRTRPAV